MEVSGAAGWGRVWAGRMVAAAMVPAIARGKQAEKGSSGAIGTMMATGSAVPARSREAVGAVPRPWEGRQALEAPPCGSFPSCALSVHC